MSQSFCHDIFTLVDKILILWNLMDQSATLW